MASTFGARKRQYNRFPVGKCMALRRQKWDDILKETKVIQDADEELDKKKKELCLKRERMRRIDSKIEKLDENILEGSHVIREINRVDYGSEVPSKKRKYLSEKSILIRQKNPTRLDENSTVSSATERRRRSETFEAACQINGASSNWTLPGQVGLCETAIKKSAENVLIEVLSKSTKTVKRVIPKIFRKGVNDYEKSTNNITRSIAVYYSGGIMGKRKYRNVYRDSSFKRNDSSTKSVRIKVNNCSMPRLLPYNRLISCIKSVDIGKLYSIRETLCDGLAENEKVDGVYRNIKVMVLLLANYYLASQQRYKLIWFEEQIYTFYISLGGDGKGRHRMLLANQFPQCRKKSPKQ